MHRLLILSLVAVAATMAPARSARADRLAEDDDAEAGDVRPFQHDEGSGTSGVPGGVPGVESNIPGYQAVVRGNLSKDDDLKIPVLFTDLFPVRVKKLQSMSSTHPEMFRRAVRRMRRVAAEMRDLKVTNFEEFTRRMDALRLEGHAEQVAARYRDSKDAAERGVLEHEMKTTLEKLFDKKEETQRAHVARMEREVAALRKKLAVKHALRDKAIAKRLGELKEEDEDLEF